MYQVWFRFIKDNLSLLEFFLKITLIKLFEL